MQDEDAQPGLSIPEVWFEPADTRRLSVLVRQMVLLLAVLIAAFSAVLVVVVSERIEAGEKFEDRQLVAALAAAAPDRRADLAAAAGREAMLVRAQEQADGSVDVQLRVIVAEEIPTAETLDWLQPVAVRAAKGEGELLDSLGPRSQRWWHATAATPEGETLVIHRPESRMLGTARALLWWVIGLGVVIGLGLLALWLVLRRRVEMSTNTLMEAVDELRVRGEIRAPMRDRLDQIPDRPIELKRLAKAVTEIEIDIRTTFDEIDALLQGAEVLGRSLDPEHVLSKSMEHLERLLGAERSAILQLDHRRASSKVLAVHGHGEDFAAALASQVYDESLPSVRASMNQAPVQLADTESDFVPEDLRLRARRFGYRSILAVPLPASLDAPTVLVLHGSKPHTYSHYEVELSASFASIAGAALRNAELFARTDQSLTEQSSRLSAIVESVDDGLLVESGEGRVLYANGIMVNLLATAEEGGFDVSGRPASAEVIERILGLAVDPARARGELNRLRSTTSETHCEIDLREADGSVTTWRVRRFTVADPHQRAVGQGLVWTDVTQDRELDRMKSGLLATVSHEFRTPLALIKGYASTLLADDVEWAEADRYEFLELVASEADRLTSLVQRLLDMRRIDAGMVDLQRVPIELEALISASVAGVVSDQERVIVGLVPAREVLVDEARIVTAVRNVIDNACKYSPPGSPVVVDVELIESGAGAEEIHINVADEGPGVDDEAKPTIFGMFVRGNTGLDAVHGGTGLGLAIARGFVAAHGGRLWVDDREGGGSVFHLALPVNEPSNRADLAPIGRS